MELEIPLSFPMRVVVKEIEVGAEVMSDFWQAASEAYKELQAWQSVDMTQDELVISYRKIGPTRINVRVSINSMS